MVDIKERINNLSEAEAKAALAITYDNNCVEVGGADQRFLKRG